MRACDEHGSPIHSEPVVKYLQNAFGKQYAHFYSAMKKLADAYEDKDELDRVAYDLYTRFRPSIPHGTLGWGAKGVFDVQAVLALKPVAIAEPAQSHIDEIDGS